MSEAGSQLASPVQHEEEEGALAGEIAAALKVREAQKTEDEPVRPDKRATTCTCTCMYLLLSGKWMSVRF